MSFNNDRVYSVSKILLFCVVLTGSKGANSSPTKKAAEKKAAYESLMAEVVPESDAVGPEEPKSDTTDSNTEDGKTLCKFGLFFTFIECVYSEPHILQCTGKTRLETCQ